MGYARPRALHRDHRRGRRCWQNLGWRCRHSRLLGGSSLGGRTASARISFLSQLLHEREQSTGVDALNTLHHGVLQSLWVMRDVGVKHGCYQE